MKLIWLGVLLVLPLSPGWCQEEQQEGDEKIETTVEKIQEEAEQVKEGQPDAKEAAAEQEEEPSLFCQLLGEIFNELFWAYATSVRFADYPYAPHQGYSFNTSTFRYPEQTKIVSLQLSADSAYHFDGTFGNLNRASLQIAVLHADLFNLNLFARSEELSVFSFNGGLSLSIQDFLLSVYAGGYKLDVLDQILPSFGLSSKLFLPGKLYLELYNLNAVLGETVRFVHLAASVNFLWWRFAIGVGYNYNRLVGDLYSGPCLKLSFWL